MAAPRDNLEQVVTTARVRLNDAIASIGGEVLTDNQPFTIVAVNTAWRRLQQLLVDMGFAALKNRLPLIGVPPVANSDPLTIVSISWSGYNNGSTTVPAPVLPQDFISPLTLGERAHGSTAVFTQVDPCLNGLPTVSKKPKNQLFEWRQETIFMPGATAVTDLLLFYAAFYPDFLPPGTGTGQANFSLQQVPIMRVLSQFAWWICFEASKARGDLDAGQFEQSAIMETQQVYNRDLASARGIYKTSEAGKMADPRTPAGARKA